MRSTTDSRDTDARSPALTGWLLPESWRQRLAALPAVSVVTLIGVAVGGKLWFELLAGRLIMLPAWLAGSTARLALWAAVGTAALVAYRRVVREEPDGVGLLATLGLAGAAVYGVAIWLLGHRFGAAANPAASHPLHLLSLCASAAAIETIRTLAVRRWLPRDGGGLAFAAVTLAFGLLAIPIATFTVLGDPAQAFRAVGATILPALAVSAVATQLAELGGLLPAVAYRGSLVLITALVAVPAAAPWPVIMLVGTYAPAAVLALLAVTAEGDLDEQQETGAADAVADGGSPSRRWRLAVDGLAVATAVLLLVFLIHGLFGFHATVTSGVSMEPHFHEGDLLVVRDAPVGDLSPGQIVEVQHGDQLFVHRIVRLQDTATGTLVTTRGDNNPQPDEPAAASRVRGRVVARLPGLGRLRMFFRWLAG